MTSLLTRGQFFGLLGTAIAGKAWAQDVVYQCPMDPEVRSNVEGVCPRCGMKLDSGPGRVSDGPDDHAARC